MFGLDTSILERISSVFSDYPSVSEVLLYGSRAMETNRPFSDIDLTIKGEGITRTQLCEMINKLDDLLLPYEIDLSLFSDLKNPNLIDHIQRVGKTIYSQNHRDIH